MAFVWYRAVAITSQIDVMNTSVWQKECFRYGKNIGMPFITGLLQA